MSTILEPALHVAIRPFTPDDYTGLIAVRNAVWTDNQHAEEDVRRWDDQRDPKCLQARWVAERDGRIVGVSTWYHIEWLYHPQKFGMGLEVHPEHQGQGIGRALYQALMADLERLDPLLVRVNTREDMERSIRFLTDRGFEEEDREWESRLDVPAFDFGPYANAEPRVLKQGITIHTYAELAGRPDHLRRLYELDRLATKDEPVPDRVTSPAFERWCDLLTTNPNLLQEGFFIARAGEEYVGLSSLLRNLADDDLHTGFTGVHPDWRRKGIALALKLRAIAYAKEHGVAVIRTDNSSLNRPMLSINERLGFEKLPAWVGYRKDLRADTD